MSFISDIVGFASQQAGHQVYIVRPPFKGLNYTFLLSPEPSGQPSSVMTVFREGSHRGLTNENINWCLKVLEQTLNSQPKLFRIPKQLSGLLPFEAQYDIYCKQAVFFEFLPGEIVEKQDIKQVISRGQALADYHIKVSDAAQKVPVTPSCFPRSKGTDLDFLKAIIQTQKTELNSLDRSAITFAEEQIKFLETKYCHLLSPTLPAGIIHGDFKSKNILHHSIFSPAILDNWFMQPGHFAKDIGTALKEFIMDDGKLDFERASAFLTGYGEVRKISMEECQAALYYMHFDILWRTAVGIARSSTPNAEVDEKRLKQLIQKLSYSAEILNDNVTVAEALLSRSQLRSVEKMGDEQGRIL